LLQGCQSPTGPDGGGGGGGPSPTPPPACIAGQYVNDAFAGAIVREGVQYSSVVDAYGVHDLRMDLYQPRGDAATNRPAIVWVHGGNFRSGTRAQLSNFATDYAIKGYVTASIDYRLLRAFDPNAKLGPSQAAAQSDAQAAIRYLRVHAADLGIDPGRIAIAGWSAGSITAFLVGYNSEFIGDNTDNSGPPHTAAAVVGLDSFTVQPSDMMANDPPFMLVHAALTSDEDNPQAIPDLLAHAQQLGIPHQLVVVNGADHNDLIRPPFERTIVAQAAPFLRQFFSCR
jgi:dienelactone hydrolase